MIAVLVLQPSAAVAECASPPDLEDALRSAPAAFVGEVTQAGLDSEGATIEVQWIWKGPDLPETLVLRTPSGTTTTGEAAFRFGAGTTYIVLLENTAGPFEVGECSGTRRYRGEGKEIPSEFQPAAGATIGRAPGAEAEEAANGESNWGLIAVTAVASILLATLLVRAYLRRRRSGTLKDGRLKPRPFSGLLSSKRQSGYRQMKRLRRR